MDWLRFERRVDRHDDRVEARPVGDPGGSLESVLRIDEAVEASRATEPAETPARFSESARQSPDDPAQGPTAAGAVAMVASAPSAGGSPRESQQRPRRSPRAGEQWLYVEASDVDVASVVRAIDGVQKITREGGGLWKVVVDRDINAETARNIIAKGGALRLLLSTPYLAKLGLADENN
ncbi:MAG: hypothetical protein JO339_26885 [Alphaproteobacteria bacterium]|nr:hypothetical protein [Alphaproteobacteria bacterium]